MKILCVISTSPPAMGGHYYSMRAIAEAYHAHNSRGDTVALCSIGTCPSPVVEGSALRHVHIAARPGSPISAMKEFSGLVRSGGYDILHGYDVIAHAFTRTAAARQGKRLLLTRCGGPPPIYHPYTPALVLFSRENLDYFSARRKFAHTRLFHIPNRVQRREGPRSGDSAVRSALRVPDGPMIVRIARIGSAYDAGTLALVGAVEALAPRMPQLQLLMIGAVYDEGAHASLRGAIAAANSRINRPAIHLRTSGEFTLNASRFLPAADFVVGTGRGAMEAMALGKPVYVALNGGGIALVNPSTVDDLAAHNFSGRTSAPPAALSGHTLEETLPVLVARPAERENAAAFSRSYFDSHLAIESVVKCYEDLYAEQDPVRRFPFTLDTLINLYFVFKKFRRSAPGYCP